MYDAILHQAVYHYNDRQLEGVSGASKRMMEADPEFVMGKIFSLGMDCFATNPIKNPEPRKKLIDFSKSAKTKQLTRYEQMHLVAAEHLAREDYWAAMVEFEDILKEHRRDPFALQMGFFLALTIGQTDRLRSIPQSVVEHYDPSTPFYGHVYGKLCFGQGENGDFTQGEISGRKALDFFPLDNWAHHALAHNFEESGRPLQGLRFLESTERDWTRGTTFSHHIWWHEALFNYQLGDFEGALSLYDGRVGPMALKDGGNFPLSDASSLLLRLHMEGVDIGDRAQAPAKAAIKNHDDFVSLFYDGHNAFSSLLAGDKVAFAKFTENLNEFVQGDRIGWNKEVTSRVGVPLVEGIQAFMDQQYDLAVNKLVPIMPELTQKIQGSSAQKDIFRQILLHAAVNSNNDDNLKMAQDMLNQTLEDSTLTKHTPLNQRLLEKILSKH